MTHPAPGPSATSTPPSPGFGATVQRLLGLAWPVLVAQISSMLQMVSDTLLAGRYSTQDLAAVAVGNGVYISVVMLMVGILQSVSPTVAHHVGARRQAEIAPTLHQGLWLALLLCVPTFAFMRHPGLLLDLAQVGPEIRPLTEAYLATIAWGLPGALLYRTFYAFSNALGHNKALMKISLSCTAVHIPLSWALMNGHLGLAPLGAAGCAASSACIGWLALGLGALHAWRAPVYRPYALFTHWQGPQRARLAELVRPGLPMGFSSFVEVSAFTLISLLIARLGPDVVAGHRITANISALIYMVPLALGVATLVLVGQALGAGNRRAARHKAFVGTVVAATACTLLALALWLGQGAVLGAYTRDAQVQDIAASMLIYTCLYQLFDAIQTIAAHALRGYKITFGPMLVHALCFWGIGLAGGYLLAFHGLGAWLAPQGVAGFWQAADLSTLAAALMFGTYLYRVAQQT